MSLLKKWEELCDKERTQEESDAYWSAYFLKEKDVYQKFLTNKTDTIKGTLADLAKENNMDSIEFAGFMSGINTSLVKTIKVESLKEDSNINAKIDFEKLYYNMLDAKADWLYNLTQWDDIFTVEKRKEIKTTYNRSKIVINENKIGRNEPCPCGSGKKYKKCCGK